MPDSIMKTFVRGSIKCLICIVICLLLMPTSVFHCFALDEKNADIDKTVTVAYIDYNNFIEKQADGSYTGYGVDYLDKISDYTDWNIEYVDMNRTTAYEKVMAGDIDFYCVARQTEERQNLFSFSLYPVCSEEMNLYTLPTNDIYYQDFKSFDGLKIGMLAGSGEIEDFKEYAKKNDFTCKLLEYPMNKDAVKALESGDVDAIALVNYSLNEQLKLIGNFGVSPAYMMSKEDSSLMEDFSKAQEHLYFENPNFARELEEKYYSNLQNNSDILLSSEEGKYIKNANTLTVALSDNMAPIEYYDKKKKEYAGVTVDLYNEIGELTGLKFRFVKRGDAPKLKSQMKNGEVQLIGAQAQSEGVEQSLGIDQTVAFSDNSFTIVAKDIEELSEDSTVAIPAGYPQFNTTAEQAGYTKFREYTNFDKCLNAVSTGDADLTYVISMYSSYLLDHVQYSDLQSMEVSGTEYGICFGVAKQNQEDLLISILNKSLDIISKHDINEIILANTSITRPQQNFRDFLAKNGTIIFLFFILIVAIVATIVIRMSKLRQKAESNAKLKENQDFLEHLYNTLPCGIIQYSYEPPHSIINYNEACANIFGFDMDFQILGKQPDAVVKKGTAEEYVRKFDLCERTNGKIMYTWPITKTDGSEAFTECVMDIVETEQGKAFQEVFIDITDRIIQEKQIAKQYSQELSRRSESKRDEGLIYTAYFDVTDQLLLETDMDFGSIHNGMTINEFLVEFQHRLKELHAEEEMSDLAVRFSSQQLHSEYEEGNYEQSFDLCRSSDGQIQWLRSDLVLRINPTNGHLMCFDYVWDVTNDRVNNDIIKSMALADCESYMSIFMATGRCLQYDSQDDSGGSGDELRKTETVYGQSDVVSNLAKSMTDDEAEKFMQATNLMTVVEMLKETPRYLVYATLTDNEGNRRDKELNYFYTNKENGVLAVTISDVTRIKADEVRRTQLLANALEAAEKADNAKSQFLSRVSHEMRTPLNAIIGFIELAKDSDREKINTYLGSSDLAAKQLLNVINDVLDMASIESGKMNIAKTIFNLRRLISSITSIYETQCKQKGVVFETKITTPVEDWLVGDELRVNQILTNLLGNAIKFTSEGNIWLTISQTKAAGDKVFVRFSVSDTGCGMSEQMQKRLFKPFEQESAITAQRYGGNGLGLSIVKSLVSMMEGSIRVESTLGKGSAFIVELPFMKSDIGTKSSQCEQTWDFTGKRVLLVEDNALNQIVVSDYLARYNVVVELAENGKQALDMFNASETGHYDAILMDIQMPEMNGIEATIAIRNSNHPEAKTIQILAQTADAMNEDIARTLAAGMNAHVAKPIRPEVLAKALYDAFERR